MWRSRQSLNHDPLVVESYSLNQRLVLGVNIAREIYRVLTRNMKFLEIFRVLADIFLSDCVTPRF